MSCFDVFSGGVGDAVFVPYFVIRDGLGGPERTACKGAAHPFLMALSLARVMVRAAVARPKEDLGMFFDRLGSILFVEHETTPSYAR